MQNTNKIPYLSPKSLQLNQNHLFVSKLLAKTLVITITIKVIISGALFLFPFQAVLAQNTAIDPVSVIQLTNQERAKHNVNLLISNDLLTKAAENKAHDILQNDYFAHTTPLGKPFYKWIRETDYYYKSAGENLAIDFNENRAVVKAWMHSQTHKENILDQNYQEIGIAVVTGEFDGRQTTVVVQLFGEPTSPIIVREDSVQPNVRGASVIESITGGHNNPVSWSLRLNYILNLIILIIFSLSAIIITAHSLYRKAERTAHIIPTH